MKLKLALALITIAQLLLFLLVLRRKKAEKWTVKGGVLFVCFSLFAALCAWQLTAGMTPLRPKETVTVTALNQKNKKAKEPSIYLTDVVYENRRTNISAEEKNGWRVRDTWLVCLSKETDFDTALNLSTNVQVPAGTGRYLTFFTNQHKGLVQVDYQEQSQTVDCYSQQDGTVNVYLRDSDYATLHALKIRQIVMFTLFLLAFNGILLWAELRSNPCSNGFSKENSLSLKGVAILMMLWHHLFQAQCYEGFRIYFYPLNQTLVDNIAVVTKICVPLFAFISGFGLLKSVIKGKEPANCDSRWVITRLYKLLKSYWFIIVLVWVITFLLDQRPVRVYGFNKSILKGCWNMLSDFLGISTLLGQKTINATWWYQGAAVMFILLFPVLLFCFRKFGVFLTLILVCNLPRISGSGYQGGQNFITFLPAFTAGMAFAYENWFEKIDQFWNKFAIPEKHTYIYLFRFVLETVALAVAYKLYFLLEAKNCWNLHFLILPVLVILWFRRHVMQSPIRLADTIFCYLGKHATNIYLMHTFIRAAYMKNTTYSWEQFGVVFLFLLSASLILSYAVEFLKKLVRYDETMDRLFAKLLVSREKTAP